jgi:exonuclease I
MTKNVSFHEKLDETTAEKQEKNDETTTEKQEPVLNSMKSLTLNDEKKFGLRFLSLNKGLKTILKHTVVRESFLTCFSCYFSITGLPFRKNQENH